MPKKSKTNPLTTRLRQILTEVLREMTDDEATADERGEIVSACLEDYGDVLLTSVEAFLALSMQNIANEESDVDDLVNDADDEED
jgi:hypothetical protein